MKYFYWFLGIAALVVVIYAYNLIKWANKQEAGIVLNPFAKSRN